MTRVLAVFAFSLVVGMTAACGTEILPPAEDGDCVVPRSRFRETLDRLGAQVEDQVRWSPDGTELELRFSLDGEPGRVTLSPSGRYVIRPCDRELRARLESMS